MTAATAAATSCPRAASGSKLGGRRDRRGVGSGEFAELAQLSAADTARYERVGRLMDLEWVAIYASALSADNIANKQSAVQGFSRTAYVAGVIDKLERRLSRAVRGVGYRFPG